MADFTSRGSSFKNIIIMAVSAWNLSVSSRQRKIRPIMGMLQPTGDQVLLGMPLLLPKKAYEEKTQNT
jgi:hypothetical protein